MLHALFDAHCDTLSLDTAELKPHAAPFAPYAQFYAIWGGAEHGFENRYLPLLAKYERFRRLGLSSVKPYLSVEGAHLLDCSLERLRESALDGVRMLNLTWNNANALSGSCMQDSERGLSFTGKRFVAECAKLSILPDMSHISDAGFFDTLDSCGGATVVASHSNSRAVCDHPRNLTDEQFKLITATGGIVGLNLHQTFIGGSTIDSLVAHALHWLEFDGAERTLALGTDFDGGITP
ncbi:MAG: membrane dipeptidase, partial [Oscillospiraceae bacterium]|nr:membrane dipeptidase [Oscillospiraceae bacterium]